MDARFWIVQRGRGAAPGSGDGALEGAGRAAVDAAYEAAMAAGGRDDGPPGPRRQYGPRYYAAYLLDPDGLRVEVVSGQE
jgi:catechol 2,3-dioxygenase-like lactoylglutathione lyase family enzyme